MADQIVDAALDAGGSQMLATFVNQYPDSRVANRLEDAVEGGDPSDFANSDFYAALWNGNAHRMAANWDTRHREKCLDLFGAEPFDVE